MANAVTYAEAELGVHAVFEAASDSIEAAASMGMKVAEAKDMIRDIESQITYREVLVMDEEWTRHPEMAVTRMDKHVKAAQLKDPGLQDLHTKLRFAKRLLEEAEVTKAQGDAMVRVYSARMIELGGYLQYLAAAKTAQLVRATPEKQE